MGKVFQERVPIRFEWVDRTGRISLPRFISQLLQFSGRQSQALGISDQDLADRYGLAWIVLEHQVTVTRLPGLDEEVILETEALSHNRFLCHRSFRVLDTSGQVLLEMQSLFALLDLSKRKLSRVPEELVQRYGSVFQKRGLNPHSFEALEQFEEVTHPLHFFNIDRNGHVNNAHYLEWAMASLGFDFLEQHQVERVAIKYVKEIRRADEVVVQTQVEGRRSRHEVYADGDLRAQVEVEWRENQDV
ncbi:acyl-ACP thioesterase domain-containing protein [Streptococcus sp. NLN76]|uniref:acyl-ACP thioesterase domain-containing protein n=1 Tax=Streptococcus sp. NLN76 TaxID=2822800 RepID=UPI0018AA0A2F|nr:acyl-ACP thioesterase domain-containing protein [Streptococcus sp. NLN76]MBF8970712.1 acyl-[acyl-carrier-protein] thioesterase [Streptococcus sp. NLN76]